MTEDILITIQMPEWLKTSLLEEAVKRSIPLDALVVEALEYQAQQACRGKNLPPEPDEESPSNTAREV